MRFDVEWLEAPGVRDCVLAATWARLRVQAGGEDVTELVHLASNTRRVGVYGPVFPLAEWFIENWWNVLYEPSPTSPLRPGRKAEPWEQDWVRRHNLLAAREGTALPDAAFVPDGDEIVVQWFPDPPDLDRSRVRFVSGGQVRIAAQEFEAQVRAFVDATLQRAAAVLGSNEDVERASASWTAIRTADAGERDLCRSLAVLGADPYDPDEASEQLESLLASLSLELPAALRNDLLEGTRPSRSEPLAKSLERAAAWLRQSRTGLANGSGRHRFPTLPTSWAASAHQTGYELARRTRRDLLGLGEDAAIGELEPLLVSGLGWDKKPTRWDETPTRGAAPLTKLNGLVGLVGLSGESEQPVVVIPGAPTTPTRRFLLARSAFFTVTGSIEHGRLLTSAVTRSQRASRAYAAELLAPASAIAARVGGIVSQEEVAELADQFGVSPLVIKHQLENHALGTVAE